MVKIVFNYPKSLGRNVTVMNAIKDSAEFIRDLWLARSPYVSGDYANGLLHSGSVRVRDGKIEITNFSKHAAIIENGFSAYNWGMKVLLGGKNVKVSKEGNRYKIIHIKQATQTKFRKESVSQRIMSSYQKLIPIGMKTNLATKYGNVRRYEPKRALRRPLKPGKAKSGTPRGFFVVSEKAIRENPSKWTMPQRAGRKLGEQVQKESSPLIKQAIAKAVQFERNRQYRLRGGNPKWYKPSMSRNPIQTVPVRSK